MRPDRRRFHRAGPPPRVSPGPFGEPGGFWAGCRAGPRRGVSSAGPVRGPVWLGSPDRGGPPRSSPGGGCGV